MGIPLYFILAFFGVVALIIVVVLVSRARGDEEDR
jgi:preprotein translocase subunit SecG